MSGQIEESKGGVAFQVVLEEKAAKLPKSPIVKAISSPMPKSTPTLEEIEAKVRAAEERRKQNEQDLLDKLAQKDKHAEEVRANKEKTEQGGAKETLESLEEKIKAAEERRKMNEQEKLEKLAAMDKHAEEVRANKEKLAAHQQE